MMVGLATLANVDPAGLSTWDKTPLPTAWLGLVYGMWGMLPTRKDDATTMAYFLDSSLPEMFKRTALFAMRGDTWAGIAKVHAATLSAFLPEEESARAAVIPWETLQWNGSTPSPYSIVPSPRSIEFAMNANMELAQRFCPQLAIHLQLLDSQELWTSKDFILHIAQMQSCENAVVSLPCPENDAGAVFSH